MSDKIDAEIKATQLARREQQQKANTQRPAAESDKASVTGVSFDSDIYETGGKGSRFANYDLSIEVGGGAGGDDDLDDEGNERPVRLLDSCESHLSSPLFLLRVCSGWMGALYSYHTVQSKARGKSC